MQGPVPETHEETGHPDGGSGGLPQFDLAMWPGQMAWLTIFFVIVFVLMTRVFVPRIGGTIAERDGKIEGDVAEARRLKDAADAQAAQAAAEMAQARANAMKVASDARAAAQAEIAAKLAAEEAKLAQAGAEAEARIAKAREAAMAHVAQIGSETATAIVEKLTGKTATAAELAAAAKV
jgi:F-type H+-transporting ATPase subunit b